MLHWSRAGRTGEPVAVFESSLELHTDEEDALLLQCVRGCGVVLICGQLLARALSNGHVELRELGFPSWLFFASTANRWAAARAGRLHKSASL